MLHMPARRLVPLMLVIALLAAALLVRPSGEAHAQTSEQDLIDLACSLPHAYLLRTWRGWSPDRGAELSWIPKEPDFVGSGLPHVGPWDYIQHVPMLWYGPGYIKAQAPVKRPVTLADVAPTQAALLDFPFDAIDGKPMTEALDPAVGRAGYTPPKLIVVLVWDAGGINVLDAHRGLWPYTKQLMGKGTFYSNAFVGSSPTSTAQDHATIGTGAFPIHHGMVGHHFQVGGTDVTPWQIGPGFLVQPTFADLYDLAMGNKPLVGEVGTADIHLGMLSHGAFWNGGDRDIALTRSAAVKATATDEGEEWNLPKELLPYYRLAGYANDVTGFKRDVAQIDRRDGKLDGKWRENDIEQLLKGFDTPARTPYQERVVERVVDEEGIGKDTMPDLLYLNFKEIDYISHVWSMNSPEMGDAVEYQDAALKRFVGFLDKRVGRGKWAMVVTADHAAMPDPRVSGGYQISTGPIEAGIEATFDTNGDGVRVVDLVQPAQAFLNEDELAANGFTVADVARYVQGLTQQQTAGGGVTPQPGHENDQVFQAVFPSDLMLDMPCLPEAKKDKTLQA
jgi:type I phosphodiesterase/nucleotide pyrophosphatase